MLRRSRRLPAAIFLVLISLAVVVGGAVATGRLSFVRTNGVSMEPVYHEGDLVVSPARLTRCDIVPTTRRERPSWCCTESLVATPPGSS
jgi:hypothetical protein